MKEPSHELLAVRIATRHGERRVAREIKAKDSSVQIKKYVRFSDLLSKTTKHILHMVKGGQDYLGTVVTGSSLSLDIKRRGSSSEVARAFKLEIANTLKDVGHRDGMYEPVMEADKPDNKAQQAVEGLLHPIWGIGPDWEDTAEVEEDLEQQDFHKLLEKQLRSWKGSSNGLLVTNHGYWPTFHAMVREAVKRKYGGRVRAYRGIRGKQALGILEGAPVKVRRVSSWAIDKEAAMAYRSGVSTTVGSDYWVVVEAMFKPKDIALAPVILPDYQDPNILMELGQDVQHSGDEVIVMSSGKINAKIVSKSRKKRAWDKAAKAFNLNVGDPVLYGKYKNKRGVIVGFGEDEKKNPLVYVDPVPKGLKHTKAIQLFRLWYDSSKDEEAEAAEQAKTFSSQRVAGRYAAWKLGPNQPLGEWDGTKVKYRTQMGSNKAGVVVYYSQKKIGKIWAMTEYSTEIAKGKLHCQSDVDKLTAKHPQVVTPNGAYLGKDENGDPIRVDIPRVWAAVGSVVMDEYHGQRIGLNMYQAIMLEIFKKIGPFIFISDGCGSTGSTSAQAKRVWESLSRSMPSSGICLAVLKPPRLRVDKTSHIAPKDIHEEADSVGVTWDNDPGFMAWTKKLTGKEHLDDMNQQQLSTVMKALGRRSASNYKQAEVNQLKKDRKAQEKHVKAAARAFKALLKEVEPLAQAAKAEFPGRDKQSRQRRGRSMMKKIKTDARVAAYLDQWVGTTNHQRETYSWRNAVLYQIRDVSVGGGSVRDALIEVGKQAFKGFQAMAMAESQGAVREALPEEIRAYLPKNIVVEVDDTGLITRMADRFENQRNTLEQKIKVSHDLVRRYNVIAKSVKADLRSSNEITKLAAIITSIVMETGIRPGKEGNGVVKTIDGNDVHIETFGAVTLGPEHVRFVRDNFVDLEFPGKKNTTNLASVTNGEVIGILKEYVNTAIKGKSKYIFVTSKGVRFEVKHLQKYFRSEVLSGIAPTDFRKLKATQTVLDNLRAEQTELYARIRQYVDDKADDLKSKVTAEIVETLQRAYENAQQALSHKNVSETIESYVNPEIIFRFLSQGRLEDTLKKSILQGQLALEFNPQIFIDRATGKSAASALVGREAFEIMAKTLQDLLDELEETMKEEGQATPR